MSVSTIFQKVKSIMTTKRSKLAMSRIIKPMGPATTKIEIIADGSGVIRVFPWRILPDGSRVSMDPREMVMILSKVVFDTVTVLFTGQGQAQIGPFPLPGGSDNAEATDRDNDAGNEGRPG
jgi:hypothetical protein